MHYINFTGKELRMKKFYDDGLRFSCTYCGECCRLPGGKVRISSEEIEAISRYLFMYRESFLEEYAVHDEQGWALEDEGHSACIFLKDDLCSIYEVRPRQCHTFPFWPENLKSAYRWKQLKSYCPGIDQGILRSREEIRAQIRDQQLNQS
jgi:Fe-S-cluster containining protein